MRVFMRVVALVAVAACLASCFAPEQFQATLSIDKAHRYKFAYDGTVVFGPALDAIKQHGRLSPSDEAQLRNGVAALRRQPGVLTAEYAGSGRYKIQFRQDGMVQPGVTLFLNLIEFRADPSGGIQIRGAEITPDSRREMSGVDLKLDGRIRLTSEVPVISQNAASTPWFGGLFGSYKWHVTSAQQQVPMAVVR